MFLDAVARDVALIAKQAPTHWRAAAWRLERRAPRRYGQRVQISVEQELEGALDRLKAELDAATYERVLQLVASDDPLPKLAAVGELETSGDERP